MVVFAGVVCPDSGVAVQRRSHIGRCSQTPWRARQDTPLKDAAPRPIEALLDAGDERRDRTNPGTGGRDTMTHRSCPKCRHWHDAAIGCDPRVALEVYVSVVTDSQQARVDAAETLSLARYWSRCRGW
jgi:hypothetical protein